MRLVVAVLFLCCVSFPLFSQKDPMKFGQISMEDLTMTSYPLDSSASAVILEDFGKVYPETGLSMFYERHVRIKILKAEGTQWADQTIQLAVAGTAGENRFQFNASTFNLVNGKVVETELPKESMFREKFTRGIELQKFTFQNVKPGSVLEYSFSMRAPGLPDWQFQKTIPTRRSEFWTIMPSELIFKHVSHGYIAATTYEAKESAATNTNHWIYHNVPAFKAEPYMSSESDFIGRLEFYLAGVGAGIRLQLFGSEIQSIESWDKVNEMLYNSPYVGDHITGNLFLKSIAKEVTEGKTEPLEKVAALYDYVKKRYSWQPGGTLGSYRFKEAYDKGMGSSADINLALASMLDKLGFSVNAVFISTRDNGMVRKLVSMPYQFNYIICAVRIGDRIILLDATEKHLPLGYLPERCINGEGFMLDKTQYAWIPTDFFPISKTVTSGELQLQGNGNVEGKITFTRDGYDALNFRKEYSEKGSEI